MASKKNSTRSKKSADEPKATSPALSIFAMIVASVPLYFFRDPFQLHDAGLLKGFYGITVWPSSILAGYAFYNGVLFTRATKRPLIQDPTKRAVATIAVVMAFVMLLSQMFRSDHVAMENMRPWGELATALPLFGVLKLLETFFYQGIWQGDVLAKKPLGLRLGGVALAVLVVHLGYIIAIGDTGFLFYPEQLWGYVGALIVGGLAIAAVFEFGWPLYICGGVNALFGIAIVWFRQGVFL